MTTVPTDFQNSNILNYDLILKCNKKLPCQFVTQLDTRDPTTVGAKAWSYKALQKGLLIAQRW